MTTYTEALTNLQQIIQKMQSPDCDIDLLTEYTEEAHKLLSSFKDNLHKTDEDIHKCLEQVAPTANQ